MEIELSLNYYQKQSQSTAKYPNIGNNTVYPVLGLCGEAGEVAEKIKKIQRDKNGVMSDEDRQEIAKELGDVLWYISAMSNELDMSLQEIAEINLTKLFSRRERGVISGNGDNR